MKKQNQIENVLNFDPNDYRTEYSKEGDLVAWTPEEEEWPFFVRRSDDEIRAVYDVFEEKLSWNCHQKFLREIEEEEIKLTDALKELKKHDYEEASRIERKYGKEYLECNALELERLDGKRLALAWVMGYDWD